MRVEVKVVAVNKKTGMTAPEIVDALRKAAVDSVPKAAVSMGGKIKSITFEMDEWGDGR